MTMLVIMDRFPWPLISGASIRTYYLLKGLCRLCEVHCLVVMPQTRVAHLGKAEPTGPELLSDVIPGFTDHSVHFWKSSPPIVTEGIFKLMSYAANTFDSLPWMIKQIYSADVHRHCLFLIEKFSITSVQAELLGMGQYLEPLEGVTRIYGSHNVESDILRQRFHWARSPLMKLHCFKEFLRVRHYEKRLVTRVDLTTSVTLDDRNRYQSLSPGARIEYFPITMDPSAWQPVTGTSSGPTLVFFGTMFWHPNVDAVLWFYNYILPIIRMEMPRVHLKIIGREPTHSVLELARDPMVNVTGSVDNIGDHLHKDDILIVPLRMGGGMRVKILEALSRGMPVVSTTLGYEGMALIPDESILCADGPNDFAHACLQLLKDSHKRKSIAQKGRDTVLHEYHWERQQANLENIYRYIIH